MRFRLPFFALVLASAVPARDVAAQDSVPQDSTTRARIQWFIFEGPQQWLGNGQDIQPRFGRPASLSYKVIQNPYDSVPRDTIFTLQYDSATFVIWHVTNMRNQILIDAIIAGSRFLRHSPLHFGMSLQEVQALLRDTTAPRTPPLVYSCQWCDEPVCCSSVSFAFDGARLAGVSWHWTVD